MTVKLTKPTVRHDVEFDGLKFTMRPQTLNDRITATRIIKEAELYEPDIATMLLVDVIVVLCIDSWQGIEFESGELAECTTDNKILLASQFPNIAQKLTREYAKLLESAEKNLGTLPTGTKMSNGQESVKTVS